MAIVPVTSWRTTTRRRASLARRLVAASSQKLATAVAVPLSGAFTLIARLRLTSLPTSGNLVNIFNSYDYDGVSNTTGAELRLYNASGTQKVGGLIGIGTTVPGVAGTDYNKTLPTGQWITLALVHTGSAVAVYDQDGLIGSTNHSATYANGTKVMNLGGFGYYTAAGSDLGRYLDGLIDAAAAYPFAMTTSEVRLWHAGQRPSRRPVAEWRFDGNDLDRIGGYHFAPSNSPTWDRGPQTIEDVRRRVVAGAEIAPTGTYYAGGSPAIGGAAIGANPIGGSSQVGTAAAPPSTYANYYLHTNNTFGAFGLGHTTGLIAS